MCAHRREMTGEMTGAWTKYLVKRDGTLGGPMAPFVAVSAIKQRQPPQTENNARELHKLAISEFVLAFQNNTGS